jgi:beta-barrel assembly-enhancing protease
VNARRFVIAFALLTCATSSLHAQTLQERLKAAAAKAKAAAAAANAKTEQAALVAKSAGTLLPIDATKEIEIGRGIAATVAGRYGMVTDSTLTDYVNLVGLVIAGEAPRTDIDYRFAVLETPDVNAFAAPGGYIFITRGALGLIESEAELAGVLAHEIAHVNRRHVIEQIRKADVLRELRAKSGIEGTELDLVVGHGSNVLFTGLSRGDEEEADSLALEYVASVGYSPEGLKTFVTRLASRASEGPLAELLSTHPKPFDRLTAIDRISTRLGVNGEVLAERYRSYVPK